MSVCSIIIVNQICCSAFNQKTLKGVYQMDELRKSAERYGQYSRQFPDYSRDYGMCKKLVGSYMQKVEPLLQNMKMAMAVFQQNRTEVRNIYQEMAEIIKIINPKLLDYSDARLEKNDQELKDLLHTLESISGGFMNGNIS